MLVLNTLHAQKAKVYLLAGQGSDSAIFQNFQWDSSRFQPIHIRYHVPEKGTSMKEYANSLVPQIDTNEAFYLIGVSLGGMLSVELSDLLRPEKTIIISSAKSKKEIPLRYRFMRKVRAYNAIPSKTYKKQSKRVQGVVEPDRNKNKEDFEKMLDRKDALFLKRATHMIVQWDRTTHSDVVVHIHGDQDHTLPLKYVQADYIIKNGSHMMALTRSEELFGIIEEELNE